jgi:hypothetical protein
MAKKTLTSKISDGAIDATSGGSMLPGAERWLVRAAAVCVVLLLHRRKTVFGDERAQAVPFPFQFSGSSSTSDGKRARTAPTRGT